MFTHSGCKDPRIRKFQLLSDSISSVRWKYFFSVSIPVILEREGPLNEKHLCEVKEID